MGTKHSKNEFSRRSFIKTSAAAGLFAATSGYGNAMSSLAAEKPVRLAIIGLGSRGTGMLRVALTLPGVQVTAVCDIVETKMTNAQNLVEKAGQPKPKGFTGKDDWKRIAELPDVDAVYCLTPWNLHTPIMVATMKGGKYAATEMPICDGYEQAWELVETHEKTGMPCMLMENYTYHRNVKMVLNMVSMGMFGELNHCECGYQHDSRSVTIWDNKGELLWRGYQRAFNNGNRYPTHGIGPAAQWTNINRGNKFDYLVSMSSKSLGLKYYAAKTWGPDHPSAKLKYKLGDVNTSLIQTDSGITICLYYDVCSPRPQNWIYRVQGTKGIYHGDLGKIYLEDVSPTPHTWEDHDKYMEQYEHPLWKKFGAEAAKTGHGGGDYLCLRDFTEAVRNQTEVPIDVYDGVSWSIITKLTEESVENKSHPVDFPDFTKGKWRIRMPRPIEKV